MSRIGSKSTLTLIARGGLANRLRAMASAVMLSQQTDRELHVIWPVTPEAAAPFDVLFKREGYPADVKSVGVVTTALKYELPRRRNLFISAIPQRLSSRRYIFPETLEDLHQLEPLCLKEAMSDVNDIVISCGSELCDFEPNVLQSYFQPTNIVRQRISELKAPMATFNHIVGLHIRGTDHELAKRHSPTSALIELAKKEMQHYGSKTALFVATDEPHLRKEVSAVIPNCFYSTNTPKRDTIDGMVDSLAEMMLLADCDVIVGSAYSSYNKIAADFHGKRLLTVNVK